MVVHRGVDKYTARVTVHQAALEAMHEAQAHLPVVVRAAMRVTGTSQQALADALGFTQTQISRRINVPGALSADELAAVAAFFQVDVASFYKPLPEAVADVLTAQKVCLTVSAA